MRADGQIRRHPWCHVVCCFMFASVFQLQIILPLDAAAIVLLACLYLYFRQQIQLIWCDIFLSVAKSIVCVCVYPNKNAATLSLFVLLKAAVHRIYAISQWTSSIMNKSLVAGQQLHRRLRFSSASLWRRESINGLQSNGLRKMIHLLGLIYVVNRKLVGNRYSIHRWQCHEGLNPALVDKMFVAS